MDCSLRTVPTSTVSFSEYKLPIIVRRNKHSKCSPLLNSYVDLVPIIFRPSFGHKIACI